MRRNNSGRIRLLAINRSPCSCPLKFHMYHACLQDILTVLEYLSFEGQKPWAVAAQIAFCLQNVVTELKELQPDLGPYEHFMRNSLTVKDGKPYQEGSGKAVSAKHALI